MKVVIDVDEKKYIAIKRCLESGMELDAWQTAVAKGTPLPKGHGRLIDADAVTKDFQTFYESFVVAAARVGHLCVACVAPTIIEADKE